MLLKKLSFYLLTLLLLMQGNPLFARVQTVPSKKVGKKGKALQKQDDEPQEIAHKMPLKQVSNLGIERILASLPDQEHAIIEFNFETADLQNLVDYIADLFSITFLTDDSIKPMMATGKGVAGNKITFRTEKPMTKRGVWNLFTTFLDMAGLAIAETPEENIFRITASPAANKLPLPAFIGVDPDALPDNDTKVRYVYFLSNATVENIKPIVDQLRSTTSSFTAFVPLRALVLTDKAINIKALMKIVQELDKSSLPETMSLIKLKHAAAEDVKKLFDELTKGEDPRSVVAKIFGARKQADSFFFPETTRVIAEPRTNTLILIGTQDTISKIEDFVTKVDMERTDIATPFYIYELQHTDAESMAAILNKVTQFGIGTAVGQVGGVQEGEKFFKRITFTPEKSGNRLVVRGDYEDYLKAKEVIEKLDVMQPEIAIEILVVDVARDKSRVLGTQMRNKSPDTVANGVNFQTSGLFRSGTPAAPQTNPTTGSIMTNLINLATGNEGGSFLLSLGTDSNIWAMFKALMTKTNSTIVANPFLVTTNKYKSTVSLGSTRLIQTGEVATGSNTLPSNSDISANLEIVLTPQINSEGIIYLDIVIDDNTFTSPLNLNDPTDPSNGNRDVKHIETRAAMANKEVIALGGLIRKQNIESQSKLPILGDLPIIGWAFKNKQTETIESNLLIFISPQIIEPKLAGGVNNYTQRKAEYSRKTMRAIDEPAEKRDPVHRWFFRSPYEKPEQQLDNFMEKRYQEPHEDITQSTYYPNKTSMPLPKSMIKPSPLVGSTKKRSLTDLASEGVAAA